MLIVSFWIPTSNTQGFKLQALNLPFPKCIGLLGENIQENFFNTGTDIHVFLWCRKYKQQGKGGLPQTSKLLHDKGHKQQDEEETQEMDKGPYIANYISDTVNVYI